MPSVFLLGDSHGAAIKHGFQQRGWTVFGDTIHSGLKFENPFFEISGEGIRFLDPVADAVFSRALEAAKVGNMRELTMPIVSTIGFNTHRFTGALAPYAIGKGNDRQFLTRAAFRATALASRKHALDFYRVIAAPNVFAVYSPQRIVPARLEVARGFEALLAAELRGLGISMLDVRGETTGQDGALLSRYQSDSPDDEIHANAAYGMCVADILDLTLSRRSVLLNPAGRYRHAGWRNLAADVRDRILRAFMGGR